MINKLITALQTALVEKGDGTLDEEATSHDDLMDAQVIHAVRALKDKTD